jgi:hypothetical protein
VDPHGVRLSAGPRTRRGLLWIEFSAAALVALGTVVQVYLAASSFFGAGDALDLHRTLGYVVVHPLELVVFLASLGAWWRAWGRIGLAFALLAVGTVQIAFTGAGGWWGGLHGLLALAVLGIAIAIHVHDRRALRTA